MHNGERIVFPTNGVGKTEYPYIKKKERKKIQIEPYHIPYTKINSICIKGFNVRLETIKVRE